MMGRAPFCPGYGMGKVDAVMLAPPLRHFEQGKGNTIAETLQVEEGHAAGAPQV